MSYNISLRISLRQVVQIRLSHSLNRHAHEHILVRKDAIDHAAEMLKQNEHREEVLAILEYLTHNDLMMGVREKAQKVLDADAKRATPPPPLLHPDDSRHMIGVKM